jgi:hypothetical protein
VQNQLPADEGYVTAMDNLATATSADRETAESLTKAITNLTEQLQTKDMWAKSQEAELKRMMGGRVTTASIVTVVSGLAYVRKSYKTKNDIYCWSHRYQVGLYHTSSNCTNKAPGLKDATTKDSIMGGDTWGSTFL